MGVAHWTRRADRDVEEILTFIAFEGGRPETAERIGREIREAAAAHAQEGLPGHRHASLPAHWRYVKCKRWLIAYEALGDDLLVHRVVDAVRDLEDAFKDE
jgi:plasmid stabilization system protein ParE